MHLVRVGWLNAAILLAFSSFPADAVVSTSCDSQAFYDDASLTEPLLDEEETTGGCSAFVGGAQASLSSDGEADFGFFLSRAEATIFAGPRPDQAYGSNTVQFRDEITVDAPGFTGQTATVRGQAFLSGVIDVVGTGEADVILNVITQPGSISQVVREECRAFATACFDSFDPYPRIVSGSYDVSFNVVLGNQRTFGLSLTTSASRASILTDDAGAALVEFGGGGSVTWGGITGVEVGGNPVGGYTVESASGTDWTQPVPEPAAGAATIATGLATAALGTRRARRRR
jgi:hypothetical protein